MDEDQELLQIFCSFCDNMGLDTREVDLEMLWDSEFYAAAFKHLFPNFEIEIDDDPIQQVIDTLASEILDIDLSHIQGFKIEQGDIKHIKQLLSLLTDIAQIYADSKSEGITDEDQSRSRSLAESVEDRVADMINSESDQMIPIESGQSSDINQYMMQESDEDDEEDIYEEYKEEQVSEFSEGKSEVTNQSSSYSRPPIPKLPITEDRVIQNIIKSEESNPSNGTVIRHETPKKSGTQVSRKLQQSPYGQRQPSRPQSAKVRPQSAKQRPSSSKRASSNVRDEITMIANLASNDIIKSIYSLVTTKNKMLHVKEMHAEDQQEIQSFFQEQKRKFRNQLEQHITKKPLNEMEKERRDRLREINRRKAQHSSELKEKAQLDELYRAQKSRENAKEIYEYKIKKRIENVVLKHKRTNVSDKTKLSKEIAVSHKKEKKLIIENIKNYYKDKIDILRDQIKEEKKARKIVSREQKKTLSEHKKERINVRKKQLEEAKHLIALESDKLKMDWINAEQFEQKLLKMYSRKK